MKSTTIRFLLFISLYGFLSSCVREIFTKDYRAVPSEGLEVELSQIPNRDQLISKTDLYVASMSKESLGKNSIDLKFSEKRPGGGANIGNRDKVYGIIRFFNDGRILWRFIDQDKFNYQDAKTDYFGDDFTAGYVGRFVANESELVAKFYGFSTETACFAEFYGTIQEHGESFTFTRYKTTKNGPFGINNREVIISPLTFVKSKTGIMKRQADW